MQGLKQPFTHFNAFVTDELRRLFAILAEDPGTARGVEVDILLRYHRGLDFPFGIAEVLLRSPRIDDKSKLIVIKCQQEA